MQAESIRPAGFHQIIGRRVVAQALGHLLAVFGKHQPVDDDVAERRFVEQRRGQHHQRVEPAARLVEPFGDVFGGKALRENPLVLERVVQLRVGHGAGFEPAIQHLLHTPVHACLAVHGEGERIHVFAVQVRHANSGEFFQLVQGTNAADVAGFVVDPDRQWRAPHPVARDRPVRGAVQPVAEASVFDVSRHPQHLLVGGHQVVAEIRNAHEPRRHGAVDERFVRAVAVRIAVYDHVAVVQGAGGVQGANDVRVRFLHEAAGEVAHFLGEHPCHRHRANQRVDAGLAQHAMVVFAERRRLMHQAGAFVGGDVIVRHHHKRPAFALPGEVIEQRLVAPAHQMRSLQALQHLQARMFLFVGGQARVR